MDDVWSENLVLPSLEVLKGKAWSQIRQDRDFLRNAWAARGAAGMEYTTIGSYAATGDALLEELRIEVSRFWPWNRIGMLCCQLSRPAVIMVLYDAEPGTP